VLQSELLLAQSSCRLAISGCAGGGVSGCSRGGGGGGGHADGHVGELGVKDAQQSPAALAVELDAVLINLAQRRGAEQREDGGEQLVVDVLDAHGRDDVVAPTVEWELHDWCQRSCARGRE
jgi:hypothetical protein